MHGDVRLVRSCRRGPRASRRFTPRSIAGVTLLDTGDYYGAGHNELLIGQALRDRRDAALVSVKFGALRGPDGSWIGMDARPVAVRNFIGYSLKRLGVDHIDIYRPGRLDPAVPIEDTVGAIADLIKAGYVRAIGLSEVGPDTIRRAHAAHPVSDLQIEYSIVSRGPEASIFPLLEELGIGVTAYGVLSRGLPERLAARGQQRFPREPAALLGREPPAQPKTDRRAAGAGQGQGRDRHATGDRVGPCQRRDHRPGHRRTDPHPARRVARRPRDLVDA